MAGSPPDYDNVRMGGPDGIRIPQEMGKCTFGIQEEVDINVGTLGVANVVTLQANQLRPSYMYVTNASAAATIKWPAVLPGLVFTVSNQSGEAVTFMVTGETGVQVASTKHAILAMDNTAGDIVRVTADT